MKGRVEGEARDCPVGDEVDLRDAHGLEVRLGALIAGRVFSFLADSDYLQFLLVGDFYHL